MKINIGELLKDLQKRLEPNLDCSSISIQSPGVSGALLVNIKNKYIYKYYLKESDYEKTKYFLNTYRDTNYFQKIIIDNKKEKGLCLTFLRGKEVFNQNKDYSYLIEQIYEITSKYKKSDFKTTQNDFIDFLKLIIDWNYVDTIDTSYINKYLNIIKKYDYPKYIIHGDFGSHNFIINNNKIKIIDPDMLIGDKLYDFYCGVFSDPIIFKKLTKEQILSYFDEYEVEYKNAMLIICFTFRMLVALKYKYYNDTDIYLEWYQDLI